MRKIKGNRLMFIILAVLCLCIYACYDGVWKIQCKLPPKTKRFCPLVLK